ncbi:MAG: alpha/beta hydrolase [Hyphomicrobiaceae bacterium]|nr:alpha/beta hydrolase [Hyphomicrobiaceae bacterium]
MTPAACDAPVARLLLAHGAGAPMTSPFLEDMARLLAERCIETARFEFPYMAERRTGGKRRPPPKAETLMPSFETAVSDYRRSWSGPDVPLLIGGKSMGGRVATLVAEGFYRDGVIAAVVALGYPFHPPKSPDRLRTAHLAAMTCPLLVVQGERDPFGRLCEVQGYRLPAAVTVRWITDGDHDLRPRVAHGVTWRHNLESAADSVASFARSSGRQIRSA